MTESEQNKNVHLSLFHLCFYFCCIIYLCESIEEGLWKPLSPPTLLDWVLGSKNTETGRTLESFVELRQENFSSVV